MNNVSYSQYSNLTSGLIWDEHVFAIRSLLRVTLVFFNVVAAYLNAVTLLMCLRNGFVRNVVNLELISLAASDLANSVISLPLLTYSANTGHWPLGESGCRLYAFSFILFGVASLNSTTAIAIERYAVIVPTKVGRGSRKRMLRSTAIVWILSCVWSFLPILLTVTGLEDQQVTLPSIICTDQIQLPPLRNSVYFLSFLAVGLMVPLCIKASCYCLVCTKVTKVSRRVRHSRSMSVMTLANRVSRASIATVGARKSIPGAFISGIASRLSSRRGSGISLSSISSGARADDRGSLGSKLRAGITQEERRQKRLTTSMIYLVTVSTVTWLPFIVSTLLSLVSHRVPSFWLLVTTFLASTSTAYDPIIYVAFNNKYKREFVRALHCRYRARRVDCTPPAAPANRFPGTGRSPGTTCQPERRCSPDDQRTAASSFNGLDEMSNVALAGSRCKTASSMSTRRTPGNVSPYSPGPADRQDPGATGDMQGGTLAGVTGDGQIENGRVNNGMITSSHGQAGEINHLPPPVI